MNETELKQQVNNLVFEIRKQTRNKAYWNATKLANELFKLLNAQPYVEANNPTLTNTKENS